MGSPAEHRNWPSIGRLPSPKSVVARPLRFALFARPYNRNLNPFNCNMVSPTPPSHSRPVPANPHLPVTSLRPDLSPTYSLPHRPRPPTRPHPQSHHDSALVSFARAVGTIGLGLTAGLELSLPHLSLASLYAVPTLSPRDRLHFWSDHHKRAQYTLLPLVIS